MLPKSIHDARYTMWATVIPRLVGPADSQPESGSGKYVRSQDPDSLQIVTTWQPDSPTSPGNTEAQYDIQCYARGFPASYRSSASTEKFVKGEYDAIDIIQFDYPLTVYLHRQSFVTNIRSHEQDTDYLWVDNATGQSVVWEIQGITPAFDAFGKPLRNSAILKRAEIQ